MDCAVSIPGYLSLLYSPIFGSRTNEYDMYLPGKNIWCTEYSSVSLQLYERLQKMLFEMLMSPAATCHNFFQTNLGYWT